MDDAPWLTKTQMLAAIGRSERTLHNWVRDGRVERRMDGPRAYYRLAAGGNTAAEHCDPPPAWAVELLAQQRRILALLEARDWLPPQSPAALLPPVAGGARPRRPWWRRWRVR